MIIIVVIILTFDCNLLGGVGVFVYSFPLLFNCDSIGRCIWVSLCIAEWRQSPAANTSERKGQASPRARQTLGSCVARRRSHGQQCGRRQLRCFCSPFHSFTEPSAPRGSSALVSAAVSPTLSGATTWHKGRRWRWTTGIRDCKLKLRHDSFACVLRRARTTPCAFTQQALLTHRLG